MWCWRARQRDTAGTAGGRSPGAPCAAARRAVAARDVGDYRRRWRGSLARFLLRDSASSRAAARRADAPHPAAAHPRRYAPRVARSASWPGRSSRARCADRPYEMSQATGRNAAHCPGWPLQRQGHPKIVSNRSAETIFRTPPLSAGDLCQPSRPDGKGQAEGQARTRAANLSMHKNGAKQCFLVISVVN